MAGVFLIGGPLILGWLGDSTLHLFLESVDATTNQQVTAEVACVGAAVLAAFAYPPRTTKKGNHKNFGWCLSCMGLFLSGGYGLCRYLSGYSTVLFPVVLIGVCIANVLGIV